MKTSRKIPQEVEDLSRSCFETKQSRLDRARICFAGSCVATCFNLEFRILMLRI